MELLALNVINSSDRLVTQLGNDTAKYSRNLVLLEIFLYGVQNFDEQFFTIANPRTKHIFQIRPRADNAKMERMNEVRNWEKMMLSGWKAYHGVNLDLFIALSTALLTTLATYSSSFVILFHNH